VVGHRSLRDPGALIRFVHAATTATAEIAGLAPGVLEQAQHGDTVARGILERAARELAGQVATVIERLKLSRPPLALAGGMLRGALREAVVREIGAAIASVTYVADPLLGAVVLARRLLAAPPTAS